MGDSDSKRWLPLLSESFVIYLDTCSNEVAPNSASECQKVIPGGTAAIVPQRLRSALEVDQSFQAKISPPPTKSKPPDSIETSSDSLGEVTAKETISSSVHLKRR